MHQFPYFPAIVYRDERPDLTEKVLADSTKYLDQVRNPDIPIAQSASILHDPVFREIADYLLVSSVNILREQGYFVEKYDFYLSGFWVQEVKRGGSTNVHVHKNSQICGWMFLESPPSGAYPIYWDTRKNKEMIELDYAITQDVTNATGAIHFDNMVPGTVMFSNSWMQHQLFGGASEDPTRCIHFIVSHKERMCNTC
jgi:hypothetical protein